MIIVPASPLNLPEAKSGKFEIKHKNYPPGSKLPVVSLRTAYCTGQKPVSLVCENGLRVHQLVEKDQGVWMTDIPQELVQMKAFARSARGDVLIGGLGLGLLAHFVAQKKSVEFVEIVESSSDVVKLCGKGLGPKCTVWTTDLYRFLEKAEKWGWDRAYFDIWQGTNECTWVETVFPLRRFVRKKFGRVHLSCWAENEMQGQVRQSLLGYSLCPENIHAWKPYQAFREAAVKLGYRLGGKIAKLGTTEYWYTRVAAEKDLKLQNLITLFTHHIGSPTWEKTFAKYL